MAAALPLRQDITAVDLRLEARRTRDASQARRLLALAQRNGLGNSAQRRWALPLSAFH